MSPLQADIREQAVQGRLTTAMRSVYLQHTETQAIADKSAKPQLPHAPRANAAGAQQEHADSQYQQ